MFCFFRSRTRTPEPISRESISKPSQSPTKRTPIQSRSKMSLARMVVEANAYSKSSSILESSVSKEEFTSHSVSVREVTQTKESTQSSVTSFSISNNSWLTEPEAFKDASNTRIIPEEQSSKEQGSSVFKESFSTTKTITSSALSSPFNSQDLNSSRFSNASRLLCSQNESLLASDVSDAESEVSDVESIIISSKPSTRSPEKTSSSGHSTTASKLVGEAISESVDVSVKNSTEHFAPLETQDETSRDEEIKLDSISSTATTHEDVSVIVKINIEADPSTSAEDSVETPSTAKEIHTAATEVYNDDSNSNGLVIDTECERNESEKDKLEVESIGEEGSLLHSDVSDAEENQLESDNEKDIDLNEPTTQHSWQTISQDSKEAKSSQYSSQASGEKTEEEKESDDSNGSSNHTAANSAHENEHDWESESNDEVVKRAADTASESNEEDDEHNEDSEVDNDAENHEGNTSDSSASNDLYIEESSGDTANNAYVVNNCLL